jgi:hypothetical protein
MEHVQNKKGVLFVQSSVKRKDKSTGNDLFEFDPSIAVDGLEQKKKRSSSSVAHHWMKFPAVQPLQMFKSIKLFDPKRKSDTRETLRYSRGAIFQLLKVFLVHFPPFLVLLCNVL